MLPANTKIYSADDHLIEPAHLWNDRVPAAFRDRAPKIIEIDGGTESSTLEMPFPDF